MPRFGTVKRKDVIRCLMILGFEGPYLGRKHQFMIKGEIILRLPNPQQSNIERELLLRILKQAKIDREAWEKL